MLRISRDKQLPEIVTYLLMKEKFDNLYKNIENITIRESANQEKTQKMEKIEEEELEFKAIHLTERRGEPEICKMRTSHLYPRLSLVEDSLEVNTKGEL